MMICSGVPIFDPARSGQPTVVGSLAESLLFAGSTCWSSTAGACSLHWHCQFLAEVLVVRNYASPSPWSPRSMMGGRCTSRWARVWSPFAEWGRHRLRHRIAVADHRGAMAR